MFASYDSWANLKQNITDEGIKELTWNISKFDNLTKLKLNLAKYFS